MKNALLLIGGLALATIALAQGTDKAMPPAAAKTAFAKAFPGAEKARWGKEKKAYEVDFNLGSRKMSALYDKAGVLQETEEDIRPEALPGTVTSYVKTHYPKNHITEAAKITKPNGEVNYEAEVNKKDLIFDASGKFIREEKDAD